jgi:hypothetical protein
MKKSLFTLIFVLCSIVEVQVKADEAVVIEVKKNLSLSKNDKVYRHYFIKGGTNQGLAKGSVVDVVRRVAVHDPLSNSSIGDIRVKVAQMEIIHADATISVAKVVRVETPEDRPVLDIEAVMVGDRLDLDTIKAAAKPVAFVSETVLVGEKVALLDDHSQAKTVGEGTRQPASVSNKVAKKAKKSKTKIKAQK